MPIKKCSRCGKEYNTMYIHTCEEALLKKDKEELGFGWGNIYIASNVLGAVFLSVALIKAIYDKSYSYIGLPLFIDILKTVLIIVWLIITALYLARRKKWGLYSIYISLTLTVLAVVLDFGNSLMNIMNRSSLTGNELEGIIFLPIHLLITYFLFKYFSRRKDWFK